MSQPRGPETERERWERKWTLLVGRELPPADWLVTNRTLIGATGRALDWAGGDGRNAIWLAKSGFEVTLADISATALEMARVRANQQGVTLQLQEIDLARELPRASDHESREHPQRVVSPREGPGGVRLHLLLHDDEQPIRSEGRPRSLELRRTD